jgi:5'-deoxynucleotidase YfbR-like HD superfamily hydrolase
VKQLDKFEMMFQAVQYEKLQGHNLQEFFESGKKQITHPQLLQWINELENQRTQINQTTKITQQ